MLDTIINSILTTISSLQFLFIAEIIAGIVKIYLLISLIIRGIRSERFQSQKTWFFLLLVLTGSLIEDIAWILRLSQILFFPEMDYRVMVFFIRFAWAFAVIQYQSLAFFIESLVEKNFKLTIRRALFFVISCFVCLTFFYLAFFKSYSTYNFSYRPQFEFSLLRITSLYLFFIIVPSLFLSLRRFLNSNTPKILKHQLKVLILCLIYPRILSDFIQVYPFNVVPQYIASNYAVVSFSTMLIACAAFYCMKRVMRLRFLNFKAHVQSQKKYNFINKFTEVLEQLSHTLTSKELIHITKSFFKDALSIPTGRTNIYIRKLDSNKTDNDDFYINDNQFNDNKIEIIENFISNNIDVQDFFKQSKILIFDDIDFSNFYQETDTIKNCLKFLNQTNAEIFIPIYKNQTIIAYIIIERDAKSNQLYSNIERDEMVVFSSYLGNIINLIQNRNLERLITKEKELKEELYLKHQEINQYKESIRSFLKKNQNRKIGIIFFKNRKFIFGNQDAKDLIQININIQDGHPLTQDLKKVARQVEDYNSSQICYTNDPSGNKLVLMGIPNLENNNIIILSYYPDISDAIRQQIDLLKDPSKWDYLLYLETTKSGQLINQLIPGSSETLLNFKINLLKIALTRSAILLQMHEDDLKSTVEIIHYISLRENLYILKLQAPTKGFEIAAKLFGINPIFGEQSSKPLLQVLDGNGTLFIENIHFLDISAQEQLAHFIRHAYFHIYKSDQKISSDVRIICSSNANLNDLVLQNKFSKNLYEELKNALVMPSLLTLSEDELRSLTQGYAEQAIQTNAFKNLLQLTDKEKINIINKRPASLQEFKNRIQQILTEKTKKNNVQEETHFDPAYNISDPKLIEAARLGKHALKDPKILSLLWNKFKNQNKIATFLGVNRSSVHRRLKEHKIE